MVIILTNSPKLIFKTVNGMIQSGKGIIYPISRHLIKKLLLQHLLHINQGGQNWNWNFPNRKWKYFSHLQGSDQKTSFTKCFIFFPIGRKLIFQTGNRMIQIENEIISPIYKPLTFLILTKEFRIDFYNRKWNYPNSDMSSSLFLENSKLIRSASKKQESGKYSLHM